MSNYSDLTQQVFRRALDRARTALTPALLKKLEGLLDSGRFHLTTDVMEAIRTESNPDSHADF
jgi:hypothetical protein